MPLPVMMKPAKRSDASHAGQGPAGSAHSDMRASGFPPQLFFGGREQAEWA
jgi:hypothetical protein